MLRKDGRPFIPYVVAPSVCWLWLANGDRSMTRIVQSGQPFYDLAFQCDPAVRPNMICSEMFGCYFASAFRFNRSDQSIRIGPVTIVRREHEKRDLSEACCGILHTESLCAIPQFVSHAFSGYTSQGFQIASHKSQDAIARL